MYWWNSNRRRSSKPFLENAGRDLRVADGAEQHRVATTKFLDHRIGKHFAGAKVTLAPEVERDRLETQAVRPPDVVQNAESLLDHFWSHAVAGDHANRLQGLLLHRHSKSPR